MTTPRQPAWPGPLDRWVHNRPLVVFFALAFTLSWAIWLAYWLTGVSAVFWLGGAGPVAAAAIVTRYRGTQRAWLERVGRWRIAPRFYVLALAGPVVVYGAMNLILAVLGNRPDVSLLADRVPVYASTWLAALWAGLVEEPGWRGFALPRLQERFTPVRATLLLGVLWGLWHLPVSPLALLVTVPLAFFYTWLYNRTHSVVACMLLHASITPAQEHLMLLTGRQVTVGIVQLVTLIIVAAALIVATRGRLGMPTSPIGDVATPSPAAEPAVHVTTSTPATGFGPRPGPPDRQALPSEEPRR